MILPVALTIAGSDPGGGAGLQSDIRTFSHLGVYGTCVVAALTAQNSEGVSDIFPVAADQVNAQLDAVVEDIPPVASKTGMLASAGAVKAVSIQAAAGRLGKLVVDPVLVSTSGHDLAEEGMAHELACDLIPVSELVTPNLEEARMITQLEIHSLEDMKEACLAMYEMEANAICITGGHLRGDPVDVLFDGEDFTELPGERIGGPGAEFHGTGCLFSAAITANLALGMELVPAVKAAKELVTKALSQAVSPGKGRPVPWLV